MYTVSRRLKRIGNVITITMEEPKPGNGHVLLLQFPYSDDEVGEYRCEQTDAHYNRTCKHIKVSWVTSPDHSDAILVQHKCVYKDPNTD